MATLCQSSCFLYFSSHKLKLFFNQQEEFKIIPNTLHFPPRKDSKFCICSAKKSGGRRKTKSNVELCNDIREFVLAVGLPQGHVPSMKELADHGRNDLAHIVRRRGYKFMRELLSNSMEAGIDGSNVEKIVDEGKYTSTDGADISAEGQDEKVADIIEDSSLSAEVFIQEHPGSAGLNPDCSSGDENYMSLGLSRNEVKSMDEETASLTSSCDVEKQDDKFQHGFEDSSIPTTSDNVESHDRQVLRMAEDRSMSTEVLVMDNSYSSLNGFSGSSSKTETGMPVETLVNSLLEEKFSDVSKYQDEKVKRITGGMSWRNEVSDLEGPDNDGSNALGLNSSNHSYMPVNDTTNSSLDNATTNSSLENKVAKFIQSGELDAVEDESAEESNGFNEPENETEIQPKTPFEENDEHADNGNNAPLALNGSTCISINISPGMTRNDELPAEGPASSDLDKDLDVEISIGENQVDINHLKFMLHKKELELSHLKEQIEKEKLALSDLHNKAEMEIRKAQKLISEKDAELFAAEESLSGLVEDEIPWDSINTLHQC